MTAEFRKGLVVVDHEVEVSTEEIGGMITGLGYPATVVSSEALPEGSLRRFERAGFGSGSGCCNPGGTNPIAESWRELRRRLFKQRATGPENQAK